MTDLRAFLRHFDVRPTSSAVLPYERWPAIGIGPPELIDCIVDNKARVVWLAPAVFEKWKDFLARQNG